MEKAALNLQVNEMRNSSDHLKYLVNQMDTNLDLIAKLESTSMPVVVFAISELVPLLDVIFDNLSAIITFLQEEERKILVQQLDDSLSLCLREV